SPFDRTGVSGVGACKLDMLEAAPGRAVGLGVAMFLPGQIVEGPGGVSDPPMHHGASGIAFQRLPKALDAFFVVEAVAPVQADIEPALGFRGAGGDGTPIGAKVEAIHAAFFLKPFLAACAHGKAYREDCASLSGKSNTGPGGKQWPRALQQKSPQWSAAHSHLKRWLACVRYDGLLVPAAIVM